MGCGAERRNGGSKQHRASCALIRASSYQSAPRPEGKVAPLWPGTCCRLPRATESRSVNCPTPSGDGDKRRTYGSRGKTPCSGDTQAGLRLPPSTASGHPLCRSPAAATLVDLPVTLPASEADVASRSPKPGPRPERRIPVGIRSSMPTMSATLPTSPKAQDSQHTRPRLQGTWLLSVAP